MELEPKALEARDLERADHELPRAVVLDVEERVADRDRHLVAQLSGAQSVRVDQDVASHGGTLACTTSFPGWPTR
jgi:hypothetical protein